MFGSKKLKKLREQTNIIFNSAFLSKLTPAERYEFLQLCHHRRYKAGEFIFYKGDPGTGMYFVERGKVLLSPEIEDVAEDKPNMILTASQCFGTFSVLYELRRKYSVKCLTDVKVLGFFRPDYETLRNRHPQIAIKFMEAITLTAIKEVERANKRLVELTDEASTFDLAMEEYRTEQIPALENPEI